MHKIILNGRYQRLQFKKQLKLHQINQHMLMLLFTELSH